MVSLQQTFLLHKFEDIDGCIEMLLNSDADFCVSVMEPEKSPYWMYTLEGERMVPLLPQEEIVTRRQDLPKVYALNGAVYVGKVAELLIRKSFIASDTIGYQMSSTASIDIDIEMDFFVSEMIIKKCGGSHGT